MFDSFLERGIQTALTQKRIYTEEDYYNSPEDVRIELIDGQIYYQAAPSRIHQTISRELYTVINNYIKSQKGICRVFAAPFAVSLSSGNEKNIVEPDISVICDKNKLDDHGCIGAPDWIIEVTSPSDPQRDYGIKRIKYRTAGVREYWIVNPQKKTVMVYDLEKDQRSNQYDFEDKIKVNIFEDFIIDFCELDL